ncbi:ABC transporter substrate-binding protein [Georgenia sp. H159]|uniref:ABC transporter substrate-binding protein n=1 Tax=Georgenia sp. H159 TaxID=3076115 RepID=UPI002D770E6B|nr:extracellular solute-binding protein [Georgenia sp. H159]
MTDFEGNDMKKRHSAFVAMGVAPVLLALAACGGGDGDGDGGADADGNGEGGGFTAEASGAVDAWAFDNADDVGQARLDHAEETLGDLEIQLDPTSFDAQKFTTRMASGDVPDVVQMDRRYVGTYAAQDLIQPLDQCFEAHEVTPDERWYPFVVDDVRWNDQVWATPQFYQPPAVLLNKDVMDAAGVTNEQIDTSDLEVLLPAVEAMYAESGGNPTTLGFDPQPTGQVTLWLLGMGGTLTDEEGAPTLDDPANAAAIEHVKQIIDAQGGYAPYKSFTDSFDFFGEQNQYVADQVGAQINAQWYPNVLSPYIDEVQLNAVPFKNADGENFAVAGGTAFVIPAGAENPDGACAWMVEVTSLEAWEAAGAARAATLEENNGVFTGLFTGSPEADQTIRDTYLEPTGNEGMDQVIETYYEVLDYGQSVGASPVGQEIVNELTNAMTAALLGDKTPEQALTDAQDTVMRAYESNVD